MFTIPNNVGMDSIKTGNENFHAMDKCHMLPSGLNFVIHPALNLQYTEFSTKFLTQNTIKLYLFLRSVCIQLSFLHWNISYMLQPSVSHTLPNISKNKQWHRLLVADGLWWLWYLSIHELWNGVVSRYSNLIYQYGEVTIAVFFFNQINIYRCTT